MIAQVCWVALILVHAIPALALFRPSLISKLYGVDPDSPLFLLFQHRAALFVVICVVCLWSVFKPEIRQLACVAVGFSMVSFLWLYWAAGAPASLRSIAIVDLVGLPFLAVAGWLAFR
jgi:hypothetical protein